MFREADGRSKNKCWSRPDYVESFRHDYDAIPGNPALTRLPALHGSESERRPANCATTASDRGKTEGTRQSQAASSILATLLQ